MAASRVTVFARNRGRVLLEGGHNSAGPSAAIDRPIGGAVERTAREAIAACFERGEGATIARMGAPVSGPTGGTIHPVLVDVPDRSLAPDAPIANPTWRHATDLRGGGSDPSLWRAYRRVGPTRETVLADRAHGSTTVSIHALEVLRDRAGEAVGAGETELGRRELESLALEFATARPELTALVTRVDRAISRAQGSLERFERTCREEIDRAVTADEGAAARAATRCADANVLTLSRSRTVRLALTAGSPASVILLESRPGRESIPMAEALARHAVPVALTLDAAVGQLIGDGKIDLLLVGADTIDADGGIHNKVGTRTAAVAARSADVPVVAVAAADKIASDPPERTDLVDVADLYDGPAAIEVACPLFDRTEPDLVDLVVTERGLLPPHGIQSVAAQHRANRNWRK